MKNVIILEKNEILEIATFLRMLHFRLDKTELEFDLELLEKFIKELERF